MIDCSATNAESIPGLPPILRLEQECPLPGRGPWYQTIGPAYLGIFVWAPFFDALWIKDLTPSTMPWLAATAVFASLLCFVFLYLVPASLGFQTGRPLGIVAASTFGTVGSEWITGIVVGAACIVWYAVAINYAIDSTLVGLRACGLIAADSLSPWVLPGPIFVKSPVYLTMAVFWIYITGTSALWKIPGVVVALMKVYSPVALLLLTAVALWLAPNMRPNMMDPARVLRVAGTAVRGQAHGLALEFITGFFAMAGLLSVDWGARLQRPRDVALGGFVGIVLAASWTAVMALVIVAGATGRVLDHGTWFAASADDPILQSFRWAVYRGIGGIPAGAILILFGLAALAPACYSAWVFSQKLATHWPRLGPSGWTWFGGAIAFVLGATFHADRLELIFWLMGLVFAPATGAMAADWLRERGAWAGIRPGVNRAGIIAWGAGMGIALVAEMGRAASGDDAPWWYSSAICGFVVSFAYYSLLAWLGRMPQGIVQTSGPPGG